MSLASVFGLPAGSRSHRAGARPSIGRRLAHRACARGGGSRRAREVRLWSGGGALHPCRCADRRAHAADRGGPRAGGARQARRSARELPAHRARGGAARVATGVCEGGGRGLAGGRPIAARLAWITIDVSPHDEAAVVLDGAAISKAAIGAKRPLNPGAHRIRAMAPGYQARDQTFSVTEAQQMVLTFVLRPIPRSAPRQRAASDGTPRARLTRRRPAGDGRRTGRRRRRYVVSGERQPDCGRRRVRSRRGRGRHRSGDRRARAQQARRARTRLSERRVRSGASRGHR